MATNPVSVSDNPRKPPKERVFMPPSAISLDRGYQICRQAAKRLFGRQVWVFLGNLPRQQQDSVATLLLVIQHGLRAYQDELPLSDRISFDELNESREDLNNAYCGKFLAQEWAAVHNTMQRYRIPKQYLFDFFEGLDHLLRFGQPNTVDEMETLASRLGGSPLVAFVHVAGASRPGFELAAIEYGKALVMFGWLVRVREQALRGMAYWAREDMESTGCSLSVLARQDPGKKLDYFVRLAAHRLEAQFQKGAALFPYLTFDCQRTLGALMGAAWRILVGLQREPQILLRKPSVISTDVLRRAQIRFVLGLEDRLPFLSQTQPHDLH